ncbi:dihydropteroate synthase [Flavobacterium sp.]|uniref:dihydropteroate synthase n=1 Tax=Flavobacterium sp. TaxID=239 RepID=UPI002FDCABAB
MTINCRGKLIDLSLPKVMGILNVTPDSFFDGGTYNNEKAILQRVESMLAAGATFIDIGAYSSKPKADFVSEEAEIERLLPIVKLVLQHFPEALLSVDTFRAAVAQQALDYGACMINDISVGHLDDTMLPTVAAYQVPYIMMHMRGTPQTMQQFTTYDDILKEMLFYFSERIATARRFGINDLIIDPGFGFAKTTAQNFEVMHNLELFQNLHLPMLVGVSRKSMIYKTLHGTPDSALNGTTFLNAVALQKGAQILRVHDVKEAVECITLFQELSRNFEAQTENPN